MNKTFKDISLKLQNSIEEFEKLKYDLALLAANKAETELLLRTFATGGNGVKDFGGNSLTKYSEGYKNKRAKNELQTDNKDLIFKKQGSLIESNIKVGQNEGKPVLGFVTKHAADVAGYQETQNATKIFQLNIQERENVNLAAKEFLFERYKEIIKKWQ